MSCDVIGHVMVLDQSDPSTPLSPWHPLVVKKYSRPIRKCPKSPHLSDNRGLYGGAPSCNKRTTNQNAPFQISTNQNEPQISSFWRIQNCTHTTHEKRSLHNVTTLQITFFSISLTHLRRVVLTNEVLIVFNNK